MARFGKKLTRPIKTLSLAIGILLAFQGTTIAQTCSGLDALPEGWLSRSAATPDPVDRQAIMALLNTYNLALDYRNYLAFGDLFTDDVVYEACKAGGNVQVVKVTGRDNVVDYVKSLHEYLKKHSLRTRHFSDNEILRATDKNTVEVMATQLVLVQNDYPETPQIDYTATLKATFKRADGVWRIAVFILITDTPEEEDDGWRGR